VGKVYRLETQDLNGLVELPLRIISSPHNQRR